MYAVGVPAHLDEDHHLNKSGISEIDAGTGAEGDRLLLFESVLEGGFGRKLHLDEGATLELAKLEHAALAAAAAASAAHIPEADSAKSEIATPHADPQVQKKRLTLFRRNKGRSPPGAAANGTSQDPQPRPSAAVTGPALAVVDAEPAPSQRPSLDTNAATVALPAVPGSSKDGALSPGGKKKEDEGGVKITIHLSALDDSGTPLPARNEQTTYLHIVRLGAAPTSAPALESPSDAAGSSSSSDNKDKEEQVEDTRPWVVKVVKREARIGPHTFHLHEIYGLTSHASEPSHPVAPTAPVAAVHTYPPPSSDPTVAPASTPEAIAAAAMHDDDDPTAECLLCLSSPREVVLLPCRHLVACRECAVNMVEFGAGGTLVHSESEPAPPAAAAPADAGGNGAEGPAAEGPAEAAAAPVPPPVPTPAPAQTRRKRKAKGWFCPVCRQRKFSSWVMIPIVKRLIL